MLSQPAVYKIKVQGLLASRCANLFDGLTLTTSVERGTTTLSGPVTDQCALHGLLIRIRDLGLPLLSLNLVESGHVEPDKKEVV